MKKLLILLLTVLMAVSFSAAVASEDDSGEGTDTSTIRATVTIAPPVITKHIMGDVDLNGDLNAADAASILRMKVRLESWDDPNRNFNLADCDFSHTREDAYGNWVIGHEVDGVWTASDSEEIRGSAVTCADASQILRFIVRIQRTWYYNDHSYYLFNGVSTESMPQAMQDILFTK